MGIIRNWLLEIVRQAIREEFPVARVPFKATPSADEPMKFAGITVKSAATCSPAPESFEAMQDAALQQQANYYDKKNQA